MPPANRVVLGRPLDPVLDLGGQRGRAGLGHSAPTLMDLDPQQRVAAQVSSGSLLTPATAPMQATDGPSTSAVPTLAADPALAAEPLPGDTPMLPAVPLLVPPDFLDTAVSSAMCLWAEDVDIPVDIARQAILYVHANFAPELSQHPSADCPFCFFFFFFGWESYSLQIYRHATKETTSVNRKAIHSRSCKLPSLLG